MPARSNGRPISRNALAFVRRVRAHSSLRILPHRAFGNRWLLSARTQTWRLLGGEQRRQMDRVGVQTWTVEERKVRIALGMTAMVAFLMIELPLDALFELIGIERHYAAAIAALVSVVLAFFVARPIARILYPDALQKADENSQRRLSKSPCSTS
jgi:hypothetical protein